MRVADARALVFDLDGTLVRRSAAGVEPLPGAAEVLHRIRASGRPLVVFTNASHTTPARLAAAVRDAGLHVQDGELLTPLCSAASVLTREHRGRRVLVIGTPEAKRQLAQDGVAVIADADRAAAEVVFAAHAKEPGMDLLEAAARAVRAGAPFLTANFLPAYAGADGPIISRGAMIAAAVAKGAGTAPTVVGKPSHAAVRALSDRLGVPPQQTVVVGDDVHMDVALGRLGGSSTVLVRTGLGGVDISALEPGQRPDHVLDDVASLLRLL